MRATLHLDVGGSDRPKAKRAPSRADEPRACGLERDGPGGVNVHAAYVLVMAMTQQFVDDQPRRRYPEHVPLMDHAETGVAVVRPGEADEAIRRPRSAAQGTGPPAYPVRRPHFGLVGAIDLDSVVRGGRSLVPCPRRARTRACRRGRARETHRGRWLRSR